MKIYYTRLQRDANLAAARIWGGVLTDVTSEGQFLKMSLQFGVVSTAGLHTNRKQPRWQRKTSWCSSFSEAGRYVDIFEDDISCGCCV